MVSILLSHIDGTDVPPSDRTSEAYSRWSRQDHFIFHAILASVNETIMPHIDAATSARDTWASLERMFASRSRSCIMGLKEKLYTSSRGDQSVSAYLSSIKVLAGKLALIGAPIDDIDLVLYTLNGIGSDFKEITAAIRARDTPLSFDELYDKIVSYDDYLQRTATQPHSPLAHATAKQGKGYHDSRSAPRFTGPRPASLSNGPGPLLPGGPPRSASPGSTSARPLCQYCHRVGHTACTCFKIHPELRPSPPQVHATTSNSVSSPATPSWLLDSAASHHVTDSVGNLALSEKYDGLDTIAISDGSALMEASASGTR